MFDWVKIALLALDIVDKLVNWARSQNLINQGRDEEIARATAAILAKTEYAKNVRAKIAAMDDKAVDAALRDLEPK